MVDLTFTAHLGCLTVPLPGAGVEQLLGVSKLASETGMAQATTIVGCLEERGVIDQVVALCFAPLAFNTSLYSNACSIIE